MKVKFKGRPCVTRWGQYGNGRVALELICELSGEPIAKASVNTNQPIGPTEMDVKNWSENDGMLQSLVDAGIGKLVDVINLDHARTVAYRIQLSEAALSDARDQGWPW